MKKYLKTLYVFAVMLICSLIMFGCGVKIDDITVKTGTIETTIPKGTTLVTDNFEAVVKYSDGSTKTIDDEDVTFGSIDTTTTGVKELVYTYEGISKSVQIKVVETSADVASVTLFESGILTDYNANKGVQINKQEEFVNKNDVYYVGDDNIFHFRLKAKGIDGLGNVVDVSNNVRTNVKLEHVTYDGSTPTYTELNENQVANYVDINTENTTFDFKTSALNQTFRITVTAVNYDEVYFEENIPSFNMTVKVIDAYNVYNATDLSVLDNTGEYGWNDKKSSALQTISNDINGIVIHNQITVTDDDLPSGLFYNETEAAAIPSGVTTEEVEGSIKDSASYQLYGRLLKENQIFNFIGNYYQIDFSQVAKVVVQDNNSDGIHVDPNYDPDGENAEKAITTHTCFFRFDPQEDNTTFPEINIKNLSIKGNGKRSPRSVDSGGLLLLKSKGTRFTADNTIYQDCFIGYMFERFDGFENAPITPDQDVSDYKIINTKGYNCYNSLLYIWGAKNVLIENSELIGAGGPVMIVDHVDNDQSTGAGGYPSTVNVVASKLESFVGGHEPWFVTYGADGLASTLKALDGLYPVAVAAVNQAIPGLNATAPTFLQTKDGIPGLINMICVAKSSSAEGMTVSRTRSKITMFETREDFEAQVNNGDKSFGLYFQDELSADNLVDKAMASIPGAMVGPNQVDPEKTYNYFESNTTGGYIGSDLLAGAQPQGQFYTGDYVNVYLFNGMGAIFGLYPTEN